MSPQQEFQIDKKQESAPPDYMAWMLHAKKNCGKSFGSMVRDVAKLTWSKTKLRGDEYFLFQLFDDARFPMEAKQTFIGATFMARLNIACMNPWPDVSADKPTLTAVLRGHDFAVPETQGLRHKYRSFPGAEKLTSRDEVAKFLREKARYPLFGKPISHVGSIAVVDITRYDADTDSLVMSNDTTQTVDSFADTIEEFADKGYLFQSRLVPHPKVAEIVGDRIATCRMFVLVDDEGPVLLRAAWKLPAGDSLADNFWRPGNLLAGVDVETGELGRVFRMTPVVPEPVDEHPDSKVKFEGLKFPEWESMKETVMNAAGALCTCPVQGWDVALCENGPVLVELEGDGGHPMMPQLCFDTGLYQGRFKKFADKSWNRRKEHKRRYRKMIRDWRRMQLQGAFRSGKTDQDEQGSETKEDQKEPVS